VSGVTGDAVRVVRTALFFAGDDCVARSVVVATGSGDDDATQIVMAAAPAMAIARLTLIHRPISTSIAGHVHPALQPARHTHTLSCSFNRCWWKPFEY